MFYFGNLYFKIYESVIRVSVCLSQERDPTSVALPDGFFHFFALLKGFLGEFFLIQVEGLRTEGVVCCTDWKGALRQTVICDTGLYKQKMT